MPSKRRLPIALTRPITSFISDRRGSFATAFGLCGMAVFLAAGVAVDYTRMIQTRSVMADALDAAVLAAGNDLSMGGKSRVQLESNFNDFFFANLENRSHYGEAIRLASFDADEKTGEISAEARAEIPMAFMGLVGKTSVDLTTRSTARYSTDTVEITMALDMTGSMRGSKIAALRRAAGDAVDILLPRSSAHSRVRIGLIPYAEAVNAGIYARPASGGRARSGCVTERGGRNAHNDAGYAGRDGRVGAQTNQCPRLRIMPLTDDRDRLLREISRFSASGYTAGHIGIAWSYYMLSENWRGLWPSQSDPARYGENVRKIAIVMTDGLFNTYYDGIRGRNFDTPETRARSRAAAIALCRDMKARKSGDSGITVFTVAFELDDRDAQGRQAKQMMAECATPDSPGNRYFYDARNESELRDAFRQIALSIQKLRLTR